MCFGIIARGDFDVIAVALGDGQRGAAQPGVEISQHFVIRPLIVGKLYQVGDGFCDGDATKAWESHSASGADG